MLLDVTHLAAAQVRERLPDHRRALRELGIDLTQEPIPVVPAAHYQCGGVVTDLRGRTTIPGLLAVGEVACTGAPRRQPAGLELAPRGGGVRPPRGGRARASSRRRPRLPRAAPWDAGTRRRAARDVALEHDWDAVRRLMWDYVGIVRTDERLAHGRAAASGSCARRSRPSYRAYLLDADLVELRNIALLAELIIRSARRRLESRGLHWNRDHPARDDRQFRHDTLVRGGTFFHGPPIVPGARRPPAGPRRGPPCRRTPEGRGLRWREASTLAEARDSWDEVRAPAVAGTFYPSDPDRLGGGKWTSSCAMADPVPARGAADRTRRPACRHMFSGSVAAAGFRQLAAGEARRVFLIGPSHRLAFAGAAAWAGAAFATPLGEVPVDRAVLAELFAAGPEGFKSRIPPMTTSMRSRWSCPSCSGGWKVHPRPAPHGQAGCGDLRPPRRGAGARGAAGSG